MNKKIAYITDLHLDEAFPIGLGVDARKNWKVILEDLSSRKIDTIIFGGDIGDPASHSQFFDSLRDYQLSLCLGNHDHYNEVKSHLEKVDIKDALYYSYKTDFHHFIFIDSSTESVDQAQLDWLKVELVTDKDVLLFIHHPILEVNAIVDKQYALSNRHKIKSELEKANNNITIFSGHYHFDDYQKKDHIQQYITPAASYQVEKLPNEIKINNNSFGYRIIELKEQEIRTELVLF